MEAGKREDSWYEAAGKTWLKQYGRVRKTISKREHKGLPQVKRTVDGSEAAYLRVRSNITQSLLGPAGDVLPQRTDLLDGMEPTDQQMDEFQFNENKRKIAKIEAVLSGTIDDCDISEDLLREVELHLVTITKNQKDRKAVKARRKVLCQKMPQSLEGLTVFFGEGCEDASTPANIRKVGATRTDTAVHAHIIIVADLETSPPDLWLAAGLGGAVLASMVYFNTGGKSGGCMAFTRATDVQRSIHVTDGFMRDHLRAATFLAEAVEVVGGKWDLKIGMEDLLPIIGPAVPAPRRDQRQREVLAFMSRDELDADELQFIKNRLTLNDALESQFVCKLDPQRCMTGACVDF